jgi:hypothetical protein
MGFDFFYHDLYAGFFGYVAFSAVDFGGNILTAFPASRSIGRHHCKLNMVSYLWALCGSCFLFQFR